MSVGALSTYEQELAERRARVAEMWGKPVTKDGVVAEMSEFVTKDSGERRDFGTGSVRDSRVGKGRFDLIPAIPMLRLAQLYERGAIKYGDRNWEKGQPLSSFLDSLERHLYCFKSGERTEDHLAAIMWNAAGFIETEARIKAGKLPAELNDVG